MATGFLEAKGYNENLRYTGRRSRPCNVPRGEVTRSGSSPAGWPQFIKSLPLSENCPGKDPPAACYPRTNPPVNVPATGLDRTCNYELLCYRNGLLLMCVLLVEDEWLIRTIMCEELVDAGYEVTSVETGDEALAVLSSLKGGFRILVTDIHMPGLTDGICLARIVRDRFPSVPIIYTTGRPDALDRAGLPGGRVSTLVKPYKPSRLIEAVRSAIAASAAA